MPPGDASTRLLQRPPLPRQLPSAVLPPQLYFHPCCSLGSENLPLPGGGRGGWGWRGKLLFLLCLMCPQHVLTCSSQTNSVTSFRWLLKCHLLEQPQLVPTPQPPPLGTCGSQPANTCLLSLSSRSRQAQQWGSKPVGAPCTNGFQELVSKCPSALLLGWMGVSDAPVLCSLLGPPVGWMPAVQGLSSLPPSSTSCHPTPPLHFLGSASGTLHTQTHS